MFRLSESLQSGENVVVVFAVVDVVVVVFIEVVAFTVLLVWTAPMLLWTADVGAFSLPFPAHPAHNKASMTKTEDKSSNAFFSIF
jgi:hypothetical protein